MAVSNPVTIEALREYTASLEPPKVTPRPRPVMRPPPIDDPLVGNPPVATPTATVNPPVIVSPPPAAPQGLMLTRPIGPISQLHLMKYALLQTPGINMTKCVTKQRPQGIVKKVLDKVIEAVPEWTIYEEDGYWPLYDFAQAILRSMSGNFKTAARKAQVASQEAPTDRATIQAHKPRGRRRQVGNSNSQSTAQVATEPNNNPSWPIADTPPTHEANDVADSAEDKMEGIQTGEDQPAAGLAPVPEDWDTIHELEKSMGNTSICMKHPNKDKTDMADLGSMANLLPAELSACPVIQASPLHTQPASTPVLKRQSTHASGGIPAPPHPSVSTTTATATSMATAMSSSTTSSTATSVDPGASTHHPLPASTPKTPGEMINREMGVQLQEILTLPKEVVQQRFPWIFEHLTGYMTSKQALPHDSEVKPDPPSDAELGPYEDKGDASSELLDEHPNPPFQGENSGGQGKRGG
ncbi:hypothetical protein FRC10_005062 [Ceratobasidium sp. 414]|nr:hypothetical protein FRC10_005062 [Ceratobasidium sp. 414]